MMNLIQEEEIRSKEFDIETVNGLVKLTPRNVAIAEAMIRTDSKYAKTWNPEEGPSNNYPGSTAFWMTELKNYLFDRSEYSKKDILREGIAAIDRENSTHLNADRIGRTIVLDRLMGLTNNELIRCLRHPKETGYRLIKLIAEKTTEEKGGRTNLSFASKFCHYACFFLFVGEKEQDNYSIYDNVVRKALPKYLKAYELPNYNLSFYEEYQAAIDAIRAHDQYSISRNGFDHLIWYSSKGA